MGLPIFIRLNRKFKTIGFDNKSRVSHLSNKKDFNKEFTSKDLKLKNGSFFSSRYSDLKEFNFFIVTVPTPIFSNKHRFKKFNQCI